MVHNCWECGKEMVENELNFRGKIKGEEFEIRAVGLMCECGHQSLLGRHHDKYNITLADAYRVKHGLLTTDQLLNYRREFDMSQQDFADFLSTGVQSIKRWEHGCIQENSMDQLIRLKTKEKINDLNEAITGQWEHISREKKMTGFSISCDIDKIPEEVGYVHVTDQMKEHDTNESFAFAA